MGRKKMACRSLAMSLLDHRSREIQTNLLFQFTPEKLGHFEKHYGDFEVLQNMQFFSHLAQQPSSSDLPWLDQSKNEDYSLKKNIEVN